MAQPVLFVTTNDGLALPVVDLSNPAFLIAMTDDDVRSMRERYVAEAAARQVTPEQIRAALERSIIGRGLLAAAGGVLNAMSTYLMKLGAENAGEWATAVDRNIMGSFPAVGVRLRFQDMARFLADSLASVMVDPERPLWLINVGGGTAVDSWNALILIRQDRPELLDRRPIAISVFDADGQAPAFGSRAISALTADGAPLAGLDVRFEHVPYDWTDVSPLRAALAGGQAAAAYCAVSSEGALFEYGTDADIIANLEAVAAVSAPDTSVVGSVTHPSLSARSPNNLAVATRPRSLPEFEALAAQAGWHLERALERPISYSVSLRRT